MHNLNRCILFISFFQVFIRIERAKARLIVDGINAQSRRVSFPSESSALTGPVYIGGLPSEHKAATVKKTHLSFQSSVLTRQLYLYISSYCPPLSLSLPASPSPVWFCRLY